MSTAVVIGGGHNGLTAAFYLAKAGMATTVLEARDHVGGGAVTSEIHPGFHVPLLSHHVSLRSDIFRDMDLARRGVDMLASAVDVVAPASDGASLVLYQNAARNGDGYAGYRAAMDQISSVVASLLSAPAPRLESLDAGDLVALLAAGRRFRGLEKRNSFRLLRYVSMPVADLVREWFRSELTGAAVAARGLTGTMLGPRSAGSGLVLLLNDATRRLSIPGTQVRGGPGTLTRAMAEAARHAGADVQTGVRVEHIRVEDDAAAGVVVDGREMRADVVISAIDPKTTFLRLIDPVNLTPDFLTKMRNYRSAGTVAKINLALSSLPRLGAEEVLSGRIHLGPDLDYLERAFDSAKYGELSSEPWLDAAIPSILDTSLAPAGAHVMSIYAHYAPYRLRSGDWASLKETLLTRVLSVLERYAPGIRSLVMAVSVITPQELESHFGYFGGHIFHGELALDQLASMRPVLQLARYSTPIRRLFLCSGGTHPAGFMSGANGKMAAREVIKALT